jgi:creatinine amidohydrolase
MLLESLNWHDVEEYLKRDQRVVIVLGATEEHADLSLCTDTIIPFQIAQKACEMEQVVLAPAVPYGISTWSLAYPGTVTLKTATMIKLVEDIIESLIYSGFRKFFILNGHGFNRAVAPVTGEVISKVDGAEAIFIQWYEMRSMKELAHKLGRRPDHANWAENFRFTNVKQKQRELLESRARAQPAMPNLLKDIKTIRKELGQGHGSDILEIDQLLMDELFEDLVNDFAQILRES